MVEHLLEGNGCLSPSPYWRKFSIYFSYYYLAQIFVGIHEWEAIFLEVLNNVALG